VIETTGAHHNPNFDKDVNRMADEFVKQLRKAGHEIRRAVFLYDYKGEHAGDTLPYREPKWPTSHPASIVPLSIDGPYTVTEVPTGPTPLYLIQNGKHAAGWDVDRERAIKFAEHYNEIAAKQKPVSGGSQANDASWTLTDEETGRVTRYWWRPAEGVT